MIVLGHSCLKFFFLFLPKKRYIKGVWGISKNIIGADRSYLKNYRKETIASLDLGSEQVVGADGCPPVACL